jgi:hypothetical protein
MGASVPLAHIVTFGAEHAGKLVDPIEEVRGYVSKMRTKVSRGSSDALMCRVSFAYSLLASSYIRRDGGFFYPPPALYFTPRKLGGIGEFPWTMLGASKDGTLVTFFTDPVVRRLVNAAAMVTQVPTDLVKEVIAKTVLRGETLPVPFLFKPGQEFVRSTMSPRTLEASDEAVRKLSRLRIIVPPHHQYHNLPDNHLLEVFKSNPKLLEVNAEARKEIGGKMEAFARLTIVDLLASNFPGISGLKFTVGRAFLDFEKPGPTPFPGLDPNMLNILRTFGVDGEAQSIAGRKGALLRILRQSPHFPRHYTDEALVSILSKPDLLLSPENLILYLVAMGADSGTAGKVAASISTIVAGYNFSQLSSLESTNDNFLPNLNLGVRSHERTGASLMIDKRAKTVIDNLGFMRSLIIGACVGRVPTWTVKATVSSQQSLIRELYGKAATATRQVFSVLR